MHVLVLKLHSYDVAICESIVNIYKYGNVSLVPRPHPLLPVAALYI